MKAFFVFMTGYCIDFYSWFLFYYFVVWLFFDSCLFLSNSTAFFFLFFRLFGFLFCGLVTIF